MKPIKTYYTATVMYQIVYCLADLDVFAPNKCVR